MYFSKILHILQNLTNKNLQMSLSLLLITNNLLALIVNMCEAIINQHKDSSTYISSGHNFYYINKINP